MRAEILKGHLDLLLLAAVQARPAHGYAVIEELRRRSDGASDLPEGTVYPALHRLERKGWIASKWEKAKDRNREFKYYRLTATGKKQLAAQESKWKQIAGAIARVMSPA